MSAPTHKVTAQARSQHVVRQWYEPTGVVECGPDYPADALGEAAMLAMRAVPAGQPMEDVVLELSFARLPTLTSKPGVGPEIRQVHEFMGGGWDQDMSPTLTATAISKRLGFAGRNPSGDGKVKYAWYFTVDGEQCAIYDYKGARWSSTGPAAALEKVFPGMVVHR